MADRRRDDKSGKIEKRDRSNEKAYDKAVNREDRHRVSDTAPPPPRRKPNDGTDK